MEFEDSLIDSQLVSLGFKKDYVLQDNFVLVKYRWSDQDGYLDVTCCYEEILGNLTLSVIMVKIKCLRTNRYVLKVADRNVWTEIVASLNKVGVKDYHLSELSSPQKTYSKTTRSTPMRT